MISIGFVSIHPQFIHSYCSFGVMGSAIRNELAELKIKNLRDFSTDHRGTVDDRPYGGGDGMVLRPEPLADSLKSWENPLVVVPSPAGKTFSQADAVDLLEIGEHRPIVFVCGRFSGLDQRFLDSYCDREYSLGDFVISGGELPALMISDAMLRLVPGVLGNTESAVCDSFAQNMTKALEYPIYTRPLEFEGQKVPDVLLSGHHEQINSWRTKQSSIRTKNRRPDLLES